MSEKQAEYNVNKENDIKDIERALLKIAQSLMDQNKILKKIDQKLDSLIGVVRDSGNKSVRL